MGRRPNATTKSGRFMNPADQERKQQRAKELKRNKKQRKEVRTAIIRSRNPEEILDQLRKIDDMELETEIPLRVSMADKREKLKKLYKEIRDFYQKESNENKVREIDHKMQGYEIERRRKEQHMAAIKFSLSGDMADIPMPDGPQSTDAMNTPYLPSYAVQPKDAPPQPSRPKQSRMGLSKLFKPPGPPTGLPPEFSDSDDDDGLHDDDNLEPVAMPDGLLESRPLPDLPMPPPLPIPVPYPMPSLAHAPPLPPNLLPPPPRIPIRLPPPPPTFPGIPIDNSVISAAPIVNKELREAAATAATISAAPQMRNLAKEATQFVPTQMKVKRTGGIKRPVERTNAFGVGIESAAKKAAKTTDEAYADFMKEMSGIL